MVDYTLVLSQYIQRCNIGCNGYMYMEAHTIKIPPGYPVYYSCRMNSISIIRGSICMSSSLPAGFMLKCETIISTDTICNVINRTRKSLLFRSYITVHIFQKILKILYLIENQILKWFWKVKSPNKMISRRIFSSSFLGVFKAPQKPPKT